MRVTALIALCAVLISIGAPLSITMPEQAGQPMIVMLDVCHAGQPALNVNGGMAAICAGVFAVPAPMGFERFQMARLPAIASIALPPEVGPPKYHA